MRHSYRRFVCFVRIIWGTRTVGSYAGILFFTHVHAFSAQLTKTHTQFLRTLTSIYCIGTASTAQRSVISPAQRSLVRADQSTTTQASRQSWREPACRRACICTFRCVQKNNQEIEIFPVWNTYNHKQQLAMREGIAATSFQSQHDTTLFFIFRTYLYDACMQRPGCFPGAWRSWHLQVVNLHLITDLCQLHFTLVLFKPFFVSERSGRKLRAERSVFYTIRVRAFTSIAVARSSHSIIFGAVNVCIGGRFQENYPNLIVWEFGGRNITSKSSKFRLQPASSNGAPISRGYINEKLAFLVLLNWSQEGFW